ncbi:MAG: hypothetical protein ACYC5H_08675 [Methylovirgula sp.]
MAGRRHYQVQARFRDGTSKSRRISRLLGAAAVAPLILGGLVTAGWAQTADMSKIQSQLNALQAQVKALKSELRHQARETKVQKVKIRQVEARELAGGPVVKGPYEPPMWDKSLHLGPVTITPGGFIEGAGVWRQHADQADIATGFGALPFPNSPIYHMNETRFSARQSRPSLLMQATVAPGVVVSGYYEMDFLGAAQTANGVESNSYNPRIRNLYVSLDWQDPGVHLLAGEAWTLLMLQGKGLDPRAIVTAPFIDADFIPGQVWERGAQVRVVKDFGPVSVGLSAENPQTTVAAQTLPGGVVLNGEYGTMPNGVNVFYRSSGGLFYNPSDAYSMNRIPDIVGKVAWDGNIVGRNVHLEGMGIFSEMYDRVANGTAAAPVGAYNATSDAWGVGGGLVATLIPHWLDTEDQVLAGRGIGRFGTSLMPDATFNSNGSLSPIPEVMFLGSLTLHATPTFDLWAGGGFERQFANYFQYSPTGYYGVGAPTANNGGCFTEMGTCGGATKQVWQITGGFWDKLYQGGFGTVRAGMQYSYTQRQLFPGSGYAGTPTTTENIVLTSLRWYPFEGTPPAPPPVVAKY